MELKKKKKKMFNLIFVLSITANNSAISFIAFTNPENCKNGAQIRDWFYILK
jgi:hypothetical protein